VNIQSGIAGSSWLRRARVQPVSPASLMSASMAALVCAVGGAEPGRGDAVAESVRDALDQSLQA
jgi:hypothetical protein